METKTNSGYMLSLRLADHWKTIFVHNQNQSRITDLVFVCDDGSKIPAHKIVIFLAVPELNCLVSNHGCQQELVILIPDVRKSVMERCLECLYKTGDASLLLNTLNFKGKNIYASKSAYLNEEEVLNNVKSELDKDDKSDDEMEDGNISNMNQTTSDDLDKIGDSSIESSVESSVEYSVESSRCLFVNSDDEEFDGSRSSINKTSDDLEKPPDSSLYSSLESSVFSSLDSYKKSSVEPTQDIFRLSDVDNIDVTNLCYDAFLEQLFDNLETVKRIIQIFNENNKFCLITGSNNSHVIRYICYCGSKRNSKSQGLRKVVESKYTGCPVKICFYKKTNGQVKMTKIDLKHNHELIERVVRGTKKTKLRGFDWGSTADAVVRDGIISNKTVVEMEEMMKNEKIFPLPTPGTISRRIKIIKKGLGIFPEVRDSLENKVNQRPWDEITLDYIDDETEEEIYRIFRSTNVSNEINCQ